MRRVKESTTTIFDFALELHCLVEEHRQFLIGRPTNKKQIYFSLGRRMRNLISYFNRDFETQVIGLNYELKIELGIRFFSFEIDHKGLRDELRSKLRQLPSIWNI